jgi:hypothetical protein
MKKCLLLHKWMDVPHAYHSKYGEYRENYRYCKRCGKWQIIIALRWFDCNGPKLTDDERIKLGF